MPWGEATRRNSAVPTGWPSWLTVKVPVWMPGWAAGAAVCAAGVPAWGLAVAAWGDENAAAGEAAAQIKARNPVKENKVNLLNR